MAVASVPSRKEDVLLSVSVCGVELGYSSFLLMTAIDPPCLKLLNISIFKQTCFLYINERISFKHRKVPKGQLLTVGIGYESLSEH